MSNTVNVKTRFAPSPTGYIHVGNVRSALYPYFIARQAGGKFVLRIEDTDQNRFVDGAEDLIIDILNWLGLDWDEGPDSNGKEKGGFGPYHQSERRILYHEWAMKLVDKGLAYVDNRSNEELLSLKNESKADKKLFLYRQHRPVDSQDWTGNAPLRFKVTNPQDYHWHDEVMGDLSAGQDAVDDFIIMKSDGLPTYNFAHIVDDYAMGITHVIRGQEYISSMPKYLALYDALEISRPIFAHLPHILAPDGKKKLGKRDGAKSVTEYRDEGYLPETMMNFLACLGWNDGTEQEIYDKNELIKSFSLNHVQKSGARFDEKRLQWMNGQWIKRIGLDDLLDRSTNFWGKNGQNADIQKKKSVLSIVQERMKLLSDIPDLTEYFFARPQVNWPMVENNKQLSKQERSDLVNLLRQTIESLNIIDFSSQEQIQSQMNQLLQETNQRPVILFSIVRLALTWAKFSPGLPETMFQLGKDETIARLSAAVVES